MNSKEKTFVAVQKVMAERGYVVFGIKPGHEKRYRMGEITHVVCGQDLGQPFQIIAETDWNDWNIQCEMVGAKPNYSHGEAFYRAVTD